jgi:peroxiredoxin
MTAIEVGAALPGVTLDGPEGPVQLSRAATAGPLIVVFYTEDATPTCTAQLRALRDDFDLIRDCGASLVAISSDDRTSHERFSQAESFPFPLLSDPDLSAAHAFGIADDSGGRSTRAVFVAGADGRIRAAIPYYNPANPSQFQAVFEALGIDFG